MDSEERINMIGKDSKIQIFKQYIEKKGLSAKGIAIDLGTTPDN